MQKDYKNAADQAINGREFDLGAEKAAHDSPEEFWVNKDEEEYYKYLDDEERRRYWAKLDLDNYKMLVFKHHFVLQLQLPKNISRKDYKREISFFSLFLRKFGRFIFKHEVLNQQCKEGADIALEKAWDNYHDS